MCSVAGWGSSSSPQGTSRTLLHNDLPLVSHNEWNRETAHESCVHSNMICAGYSHGGGDSCYDDGGMEFSYVSRCIK